jgi:predicted porin
MKKSLIALAALAAVSAASAQSSVSLYGIADIYVGKAKGVSAAAGDGGLAGSRWGVKGAEDLGGGLKANFNLEQAVNLGTGAATGFTRQANVGLSGGFGTVKLGRSFTAYDDIHGAANSGFDSALSATNGVWVDYQSAANAQIYYATPEMGGLSGAVGFNLKGNQALDDVTSMHVKYVNGPIYAGLAYQDNKTTTEKHTLINGSYDLGVAKILASYSSVKNPRVTINGVSTPAAGGFTDPKATEYQLGVDVPVSSNLTLSAGYAYSQTKANSGAFRGSARNSAGYGLAAGYSLSKRTMVYGGFNANKTNGFKNNLVAMGVNHTF